MELGTIEAPTPPPGNHVAHVVGMGPERKMLWSDAGGVITGMHHVQPLRDRTVMQFVAESVHKDFSATDAKLAITAPRRSARPEPAFWRLPNAPPETNKRRSVASRARLVRLIPRLRALLGLFAMLGCVEAVFLAHRLTVGVSVGPRITAPLLSMGLVISAMVGSSIFGVIPFSHTDILQQTGIGVK